MKIAEDSRWKQGDAILAQRSATQEQEIMLIFNEGSFNKDKKNI